MGIKSKNRHKLGIWLVVCLILALSAATVRLYPYMQNQAENYRERTSRLMEKNLGNLNRLAAQMIKTGCVSYWEAAQEEKQKALTASQVFLPGLEERMYQAFQEERAVLTGEKESEAERNRYRAEDYQELQELMDRLGREWRTESYDYGSVLNYRLYDGRGEPAGSNVENPDAFFNAELKPDEIQAVLSFQDSGNMKVEALEGEGGDLEALRLSLETYGFFDPLEEVARDGYQYSGVTFLGPRGCRLQIRCSPASFSRRALELTDGMGTGLEESDYLLGGGYHTVLLVMCIILLAAALFLPEVKCFQLGRGLWCRTALEPLICAAAVWWVAVYEGNSSIKMIMSYMDGSLAGEFVKAEFQPIAALAFAVLVNVGFWVFLYAVLFWMGLCIRAVFTMGPVLYLRERSLIGRGGVWISGRLRRTAAVWKETDWTENSNRRLKWMVMINFVILSLITSLWLGGIPALALYSLILLLFLVRCSDRLKRGYHSLESVIGRIAAGDLDVEITEDFGIFNPLKDQLMKIQSGLQHAVTQEVKSERMKAELITNVSHDLKTPLTAIITYVNLLKQDHVSKEERDSYIRILDQKSMRLKSLIEDLFEVAKASSGSISLHREEVDVVSLLKQVVMELTDKMEESRVEFRFQLPEEKVILRLDGQKTCRIFENLILNILKYAMPGTRAYLEILPGETGAEISMRNISARELHVSPEELTERFVRGDESRGTDGSGLGLAIARGFVEAQGGTMKVSVEDDVFKVVIFWKYPEQERDGEP